MTTLDYWIVIVFLALVATVSILASRGERDRADYFLAGRGLPWWLIGTSLIASNISTEHFVGMTGNAAKSGLAVASYEWLAAPALVFVGWWLLPRFLRAGIFTIPEFLEYRFDRGVRTLMAGWMAVFFVITVLASVVYSGAVFLIGALDLPALLVEHAGVAPERAPDIAFQVGVWGIGLAASVYTIAGGLKAVVWSDLIQGIALVAGGAVVLVLALQHVGDGAGVLAGWRTFSETHADQLHVVRAWDDPDVPSLSLVSGLWIPTMFYWGLNQFITQRTLAAGSLSEGQKGIFFAAGVKLFMPFIVVIPGMLALDVVGAGLGEDLDAAYPMMLAELLPAGLFGLMLAAIAGAVLSTFNSGLNSAATIVTLDLWVNRSKAEIDERRVVLVGRVVTAVLAVAACLVAPVIKRFDGVFDYIQELWGFVSAPTCAVFAIGLMRPRAPAVAARFAFIVGPLLYLVSRAPSWIWTDAEAARAAFGGLGGALYGYSSMAFLYHMFVIFVVLVGVMLLIERRSPLPEPRVLPDRAVVDVTPHPRARMMGAAVLAGTAALYALFW